MPDRTATPTPPELMQRLAGTRFRDVQWFSEIDSTNRYLLDEAAAGADEGVVAVADSQTAGRGRLGRRWEAAPGASLLVSALLRPALAPRQMHLVTVAAAVGAAQAVLEVAGFSVGLKWPNDLVVGDRKLAGLLAEALPGPAIVVGMGLNVHQQSFPPDLAGVATSCLLESGRQVERADLLVSWLRAFDTRLADMRADGGASLRADYAASSATLGRRVSVTLGSRGFEAVATGIDDCGHLIVTRDDGVVETIAAGDVVNLRSA